MSRKHLKKQCKAKSKRSGERCERWARSGYDVCMMHGAGTKKKPGGAPIKTGLHSKVLKKKLSGKVKKHLKDEKTLLDIKGIIAFKKVLLEELVSKRLKKGKKLNIATINNATQILTSITTDIEKYEKIEHGEKHTFSVTVLQQAMVIIVQVIDDNVSSEKEKNRIFKALGEFGIKKADIKSIK